jgi:tripartite-type tricarboxylate transporter receptor subunit TctC
MKTLLLIKKLVGLFLAVLSFNFLLFVSSPWGLDYPSKPINFVVPWGPGGPSDVQARMLAEAGKKELGVPIVVINKPGPAGALGTSLVAKEKPDGYTFLVCPTGTLTAVPWLIPDLPFKMTDFTPVFTYATVQNYVAVRTDAPWKTFQDFLGAAKKNPGKLRSGCAGPTINLIWEVFVKQEGLEIKHLMYKSGAESILAVLGGHTDVDIDMLPPLVPHLEAGKLRLLVGLGAKRNNKYPDVPTLYELGYKMFSKDRVTMSVFAPTGLPKPILEKFVEAFKKVLSQSNVKNEFEKTDIIITFKGPEELSKDMDEDYKFWGELSKQKK